jgi:hypothetical protein
MSSLPTGTVTFLFTDIEGSTALWERHRDLMQAALAQHHAILRASIESNAGHVFNIVGDAFCAAFATAPAALAAAVAAQRALQSTINDPESIIIRVRMGLHTGSAEAIDHDYRSGPTLNRVARVMSLAHGGQILLSQTMAAFLVLLTLLAAIPSGSLGDRFGRKRFLALGLLLVGVFAWLAASAATVPQLLLYLCFLGIGNDMRLVMYGPYLGI